MLHLKDVYVLVCIVQITVQCIVQCIVQCTILYLVQYRYVGCPGTHWVVTSKQIRTKLSLVLGGSFPYTYQLFEIIGICPIMAQIKIDHEPI